MAVIHVEFCAGTDYQYPGTPRLSETVANGTGSGASELGEIVIVTNTGETDAYVAIGTAPDTGARQQNGSVTSARMLLQAGDMRVVGGALTATDLPVGSRVSCADVPSGLAVPPTLSASASLSGRTLTLTVDSLIGTPTPAVQLTELTLNGVDVRAEATGSGPWAYVIPNSTEAQNVTWELTATNAAGSDTAAGSEMVAAYIVAPDRMEAPSLEVIGTDTIRVTLGNERSNGGAPIQSYDLRYRQDRGSWQIVPDVTNPFDLGGLTPGASVDIQNRADNGTASSLWSSHANATTWRAPVAAVTSTPGVPVDGQHIAASDITYNETTAGNPDTTVYSRGLTVDGGAFLTLEDGDVTMSEGEVIRHALRIQHAQSATDTVLTSAASTVGTAPVAPSATLNVTRSGRTVTAWLTDVTGSPDPLPATLDRFDAAGVDVRGSVGGSGTAAAPWTHAVPASASDTPIVITARLENGVGAGWSGSDSSITIPANLFAPAISGLPTIGGTERVGEPLTATPAPVTGTPVPTTTWQWERGGTPIAGATASAYTLVSADAGQTLTVVQTETSPQGTDSVESAATGTIAQVPAGSITFTPGTYLRNADGTNPSITNTDIVTTDMTGPYFLDILTVTNGTTPSQTDMNTGSGPGVLEKVSLGPQAVVENLGGTMDLSVSITDGRIYQQYRDSSGVVSALTSITPADAITYDAMPPTFSGAEIGAVDARSLIVTLDKAIFGTTSPQDWDVRVAGASVSTSAVTFISGSDTIDITLSAAVASGETVTVAYTGSGLVGTDGELMATFTAQSVTNNVSGGGIVSLTYVGSDFASYPGTTTNYSFSSRPLGNSADGEIVVVVLSRLGATDITGCTADGNTLIEDANYQNGDKLVHVFRGACAASTGVIAVQQTSANPAGLGYFAYRLDNAAFVAATGDDGNTNMSNSVNTITDGAIIGGAIHYSDAAMSWSGITNDGSESGLSGTIGLEAASAPITAGQTPRTVGLTVVGYGTSLVVSYEPAA